MDPQPETINLDDSIPPESIPDEVFVYFVKRLTTDS